MDDLLDVHLRTKVVFDSRVVVHDECDFVSKEPNPSHEFYLKIEKIWTPVGVKWNVKVPNFISTSTDLYEAIFNTMLQINTDGPEISRLKDWVASIKK